MKTPWKRRAEVLDSVVASIPMSRSKMHEAAKKRIDLITKEFKEGFEFLEDYPKSVTVFGSSLVTAENDYYKKAVSLCKRIASELGYAVITGGGPGIMEAANRGAFEAQGNSLGITIRLPHEQKTNGYISNEIGLTHFFTRKVCLSFSAEAYIFFPGGFGTLDEFFEILCLVQTQKIEAVPLILFGSEYWKPLENFMREEILSRQMIDDADFSLFTIVDSEEAVLELIKKAPIRIGI